MESVSARKAMLLALLVAAGAHSALAQVAAPAVSEQARASYEEKTFTFEGVVYSYRVLTPPAVRPGERYPLLFFLHDAAERGSDNLNALRYLPDQMARTPYRERCPAFVIIPQCREGERWVEADWAASESSRMRPNHRE